MVYLWERGEPVLGLVKFEYKKNIRCVGELN